MKTAEEILTDFGCPDIPFDENVTMYYPAILSAMQEFAEAYHAAQLEAGIKAKAREFPTMDKTYWLVTSDELPSIDFGKEIEVIIIKKNK